MNLKQDAHPVSKCSTFDLASGGIVDRRHYDKDAIRAERARLHNLVRLVDEILAQSGQRGRVASLRQEFRPTLERRRIGEHGQARCAALLVCPRQRGWVEIGSDQTPRRARLLDLGNEGVVAAGKPALDRAGETARRRGRLCFGFEYGQWLLAFGGGDLVALVRLDLFQDVGHHDTVLLETAIRRSRRPSASPLSIALAARARASWRSPALRATISVAAALRMATSRNGPGLPFNTSSSAAALCDASPPRKASGLARRRPASSGAISKVRTLPSFNSATLVGPDVVISSSPSEPCTAHTRSEPTLFNTCTIRPPPG